MKKSEIKKTVYTMINSQLSVGIGFGMKKDYDLIALAYYRIVGMLDVLTSLNIIETEKVREYKKLVLDLLYNHNL